MKILKPIAASLMLGSALTMSAVATAKSTIDVLVVYTDEMLQEAADPNARIALMGKWMNDAFKSSNVDADVRIVHTQKVNFANDSKTDEAALNALTSNADIAKLRQDHGADMVAMITSTGPYCGIAWVPGSRSQGKLFGKNNSFSVTGANCTTAFAHELGHNLGLGHSAAQGSEGSLYPWARGHGISSTFVTTMAYPSAYNTRVVAQRFSNPAISTCTNNLPCGIARDQNNGADAVRNLNQVAPEVAAYLASTNGGGGDDGGGGESDTEAPTKPGTLKASNIQQNNATLNWIASTDNVGVDHYEVFRDNNRIATSNQTTYGDGGLAAGTTYRYHVIAKDKAGNSSPASDSLSVTTLQAPPPADTTPPTAPSGLNVTDSTTSSISLSWQAATDNIGVTGYQVLRNGTQIASSAATSYTDSDNNLAQDVSYYYEVKAVDAANNVSATSNRIAGQLKKPDINNPGAGSDADNILKNGHFNSLEGWNRAAADIAQSDTATGGSKSLLVSNRTAYYSGAYQFIAANQLESGASYAFQADIRLTKAEGSAPVVAVLNYPTADGWKSHTLSSSKVSNTGWSRVSSSFDVNFAPTGKGYIYVYGPNERFDMLMDEVLIKKVKSAPPTTENENLVNNPGFEKSVDGWESFYGGSMVRDTDAFKGQGAAKLSNRKVFYTGIVQDLSKTLKAGKTYNFSATMKHTGSEKPQYLDMYIYYQAEGQYRGKWLEISSKSSTKPNTWTELQGSFTTSGQPITEAYLMMFGPDANVDLHLDEVSVKEAK